MEKEFLNDFEELILTLVASLRESAYGAAITIEIEQWLGRKVTLSAVHVILYRLEDKGYIKSIVGGATNERGGRRKRIYSITNAGLAVLRSMKETRIKIWKLVPQLKTVSN
jgi:PadR family transcriptional regulator, regulatory protein PadR